ncbi:uncharacterized protein LOC131667277 [Phymastichus coffea]|uniref:uncharacterized protein LOC131667277 n=1 Tax=Phymastichus coffea TaxID=108790 RepID=UPI00273AE9B0|nr:uncharacterized protein LOC131667277 [Phymastichus coffea]
MSTYGQSSSPRIRDYAKERKALLVDLRSDTISRPSPAMKRAIAEAELGDDVWSEDPTVIKLEEKAAELLGKEAALFVSSGTMGNLISVLNHCDVRGSEAYCGEDSHIVLHEQGGAAQIGGVTVCPLPNNVDGTFDLRKLENKIKADRQHEPISKLVAVENTINGKVVPQKWIDELAELAKKHHLKMHMDGARLWNASVASGLLASKIVEKFDSATFCLSKLGAPVGSVLCGNREFIAKARRVRKVLGGGMRQVGILAAAGIVALDEIVPLLRDDHRRAFQIAKTINDMNCNTFNVDLQTTHTNMVLIKVTSNDNYTALDFVNRLQTVKEDVDDDRVVVRGLTLTPELARLVWYYEITDEMTDAAERKIKYVIREYQAKRNEK